MEIYKEFAQKLLDEKKAYYCYMTKEELDSLRESQRARGESPRYDRRYRDFSGKAPDIPPAIRIKAPLNGSVNFRDHLKGEIEINASDMDDFIIMRSDGTPTYNFVVAIDDALMNISDIIRGDDHLTNTPKQILIYNALGFNIPRFCHIPMILNPQGKKLSKRDGALNVMEYREMGFLPEALLNFLLRLGFSHGDKEIFSFQEMRELFNLDNLSASPSAYNESKLLWLNNHYLKNLNSREFGDLMGFKMDLASEKKELLFNEVRVRCNTINECKEMIDFVLSTPKEYDVKMRAKIDENAMFALKLVPSYLTSASNIEEISSNLSKLAGEQNIKTGALLSALRCALLGKSGGMGVSELIFILGLDETKKRVEYALQAWANL